MMNKGWYKKYEYAGIDQPLTKATKKMGSSKATSVTSTEGSTAILDPGYWSNVSTSETQFISSHGACSAIGLRELKENRNLYMAQNKHRIFHELAVGQGEHLRVIATYSLCEDKYFDLLSEKLQSRMNSFLNGIEEDYGSIVDKVVGSDSTLSKGCFAFDWI